MADKITIDMELRFIDNVTSGAKATSRAFDKIEKDARDAGKEIDKLDKKKAEPSIDADTSKVDKKLSKLDSDLRKFGLKKTRTTIDADDRASSKIANALNKARQWSGKKFSAFLALKDSDALRTLDKMSDGLRNLTKKTWSIAIKVPSTVFQTLTRLKNSLFNIKNLIAGIAAAWAVQQAVVNPIKVADAYSSAKISFSTLLGESQGQKMMDDLDQFAKATPFNTTNVIENAQKMLAMGWDAEDIIKDMEIIGNAAAATGKLDVGLESIVRAMSQIKTKGKLSTEELNQLAEAGIAAKAMLAEQMGYGTGDAGIAKMTKDLEDGKIASDVAIEALLAGMQKYDGMMDSMANETVEGLISQMQDAFNINIVRKWGQGLQDGAKRGLGTVVDLLDEAEDALKVLGDTVYEVGKTISNWAADRLEKAVKRITQITGSKEFKNANLFGKISMLWNGVVADPLKEWWEGGGQEKTAKTAGKIGEWMGKVITDSLLAIFGATDILDDSTAEKLGESGGMTVAQSFAKGFKDNFDGAAITDAIVDAIGNVWGALPTWAKVMLGVYGTGKAAGGIANLAGGVSNFAGGVSKVIGSYAAGTGLIGAIGSTGNYMVSGTGILGKLAGAGYALTGGPASAGAYFGAGMSGGAAALLGGSSIAGGVTGGIGIISGLIDLWKGFKSSGKEAKDNYFTGGTKLAMVGTGALAGGKIGTAIGAAFGGVGAVPGALIGAGIGGLGALLGGDKLGEWLSDLTDDFPATKESITNFFTVTLPEKWNSFWSSVGGFFSETVPYALGYATGKVYTFFTETIPEKWDALWTALGNFFTETIPNWVSSLWNDHIVPFWTETLPGFFPQLWDSITGFFTEELPAIGSAIWGAISSFFTVTIPGWAKSAMDSVSSWWGGVKESFGAGFDAGSGKKARGGIVGGSSALESFARGGVAGFSDGGIVRGGSKLIEVAEEGSPEMIIPLSSQRRDRAMQLWMKAGQMLGVDNYFRGGRSDGSADEQARLQYYGAGGNAGGKSVQVDVGGISIDVHVDAADSQSVAEVIKEKLAEAADDIAGIFADAFGAQFENTPVRGGT